MRIYPEIKKAAIKAAQIKRLTESLNKNSDIKWDCIDFSTAKLVCGLCESRDGLYENSYRIAEAAEYYYISKGKEYDTLYFRTDTPGELVKVYYKTQTKENTEGRKKNELL